ncbi:ribokinase [Lichenicola sp.]|uniref:ribokinase n=1 Tax=Lichenicola sp. TaxID=2804529 RepID=UPI003B006D5C
MIVVFGAIGVDIVTRVPRFPRPGESIACDGFDVVPGTKGANQALAAARAGASVTLVATRGEDESGIVAASLLQAAGVDLRHVRTVSTPTGTCLITVDAAGENTVIAASSANRHTTVSQLEACAFGAGDVLLLQCELPLAETFAAVQLGRARGARIVLNAAPAAAVPPEVLAALDLLVVNETEAESIGAAVGIADTDPEAIAGALHRQYGCATVVTLGGDGAVLWDRGIRHHVPALAVQVVDSTAAGDSFTGYMAAALEQGLGLEAGLRHGAAAGSLCCTRHGAQTGIPDRAEVLAALGEPAA